MYRWSDCLHSIISSLLVPSLLCIENYQLLLDNDQRGPTVSLGKFGFEYYHKNWEYYDETNDVIDKLSNALSEIDKASSEVEEEELFSSDLNQQDGSAGNMVAEQNDDMAEENYFVRTR